MFLRGCSYWRTRHASIPQSVVMFTVSRHPAEVISTLTRATLLLLLGDMRPSVPDASVSTNSLIVDSPPRRRKHINFVSAFHGGVDLSICQTNCPRTKCVSAYFAMNERMHVNNIALISLCEYHVIHATSL